MYVKEKRVFVYQTFHRSAFVDMAYYTNNIIMRSITIVIIVVSEALII